MLLFLLVYKSILQFMRRRTQNNWCFTVQTWTGIISHPFVGSKCNENAMITPSTNSKILYYMRNNRSTLCIKNYFIVLTYLVADFLNTHSHNKLYIFHSGLQKIHLNKVRKVCCIFKIKQLSSMNGIFIDFGFNSHLRAKTLSLCDEYDSSFDFFLLRYPLLTLTSFKTRDVTL